MTTTIIITSFIGLILGGIVVYLGIRPQLNQRIQLNTDIQKQNETLIKSNQDLKQEKNVLENEKTLLCNDISHLTNQREEATKNIVSLEQQAKESADVFYKQSLDLARANLEKEELKFQQAKDEYQEDYFNLMEDCVFDFESIIQEKQIELDDLKIQMAKLTSEVSAAVAAAKRAQEMKDQASFYKLNLPAADLEEIKVLRSIENRLRNKEPLNKVIWKCYYEKPTTDLIGRVIGSGVHTGIYKITNLQTGQAYIGQSLDVRTRLRQHIKAGLGIDSSTNRFYTAMKEIGPENFSYEIIEKCDKEQLNERECYWIEFYDTIGFGYNETKGGSTKRNK